MAQIPLPIIGRDVAISLTPQSVDSDGVLSNAYGSSAISFVGRTDRFEFGLDPRLEEISSMDSTTEHDVLLKNRTRARLSEITWKSGSLLMELMMAYERFKLIAILGGKRLTWYCTRGSSTSGYEVGKSLTDLELRNIDVSLDDTENPVYEDYP